MNRWIKKGVAACLALGLGFASGSSLASSGSVYAAANKVEKQTHQAAKNVKPAKKTPSWLFVLQAKKGTISKTDKKGVYTLTIQRSDMEPVIAFTDRPDRIVKKIMPEQLKKIWTKGPNSFEKDPPNAVLSARGLNAQIVEITALGVGEHSRITFTPHSGGDVDIIGKRERVILVVDDQVCFHFEGELVCGHDI